MIVSITSEDFILKPILQLQSIIFILHKALIPDSSVYRALSHCHSYWYIVHYKRKVEKCLQQFLFSGLKTTLMCKYVYLKPLALYHLDHGHIALNPLPRVIQSNTVYTNLLNACAYTWGLIHLH